MSDTEPATQTVLGWLAASLGAYALLLPLTALVVFVLTLIVVIRGRGPMAAASLLLLAHVPLFVGLFAMFQGAIASLYVIASSEGSPKPASIAEGVSMALAAPLVALLLTAPSYLVAAIGALIRALLAPRDELTVQTERNVQ